MIPTAKYHLSPVNPKDMVYPPHLEFRVWPLGMGSQAFLDGCLGPLLDTIEEPWNVPECHPGWTRICSKSAFIGVPSDHTFDASSVG